jgi:hypothetical protein
MTKALRLLIAIFAAALSSPGWPEALDTELQEAGRALSKQFEAGEIVALYLRMTPALQRSIRSAAELATFRAQVLRDAGPEKALISESTEIGGDVRTYRRVARRERLEQPVIMAWTLDAEGHVAGFFVRVEPPPAPTTNLDYETKTRLRLPFDGAWYVFWGGRTFEQNEHVISREQRFAYDFVVRQNRTTHAGDGTHVEDYFCWNRPVLAPADGTVVETVDGLPDNVPGAMDAAHPAGNAVMLLLGDGEFALLAHLRSGTLRVKAGDAVKSGAELGRCGNSGNTSEPHLHFHLQDGPSLGNANGLPAFFVEYFADGKPIARGEPVRGETVMPSQRVGQ